jgi:hypothetical protein
VDDEKEGADQDKTWEELCTHFVGVIGPSMDRARQQPMDRRIARLEQCCHELLELGDAQLALCVGLLMAARSNGDTRSITEAMLLHADKRKTDGAWP